MRRQTKLDANPFKEAEWRQLFYYEAYLTVEKEVHDILTFRLAQE